MNDVVFLQLHADAENLGYQQCEEAFTQRIERDPHKGYLYPCVRHLCAH